MQKAFATSSSSLYAKQGRMYIDTNTLMSCQPSLGRAQTECKIVKQHLEVFGDSCNGKWMNPENVVVQNTEYCL